MYTDGSNQPTDFEVLFADANKAHENGEFYYAEIIFSLAGAHATTNTERATALHMRAVTTGIIGNYDEAVFLSSEALRFADDDITLQQRILRGIAMIHLHRSKKVWLPRSKRKLTELANQALEQANELEKEIEHT
jgi:hypothetical protein